MAIIESFVAEILQLEFGDEYESIYEKSQLLQYLDRKLFGDKAGVLLEELNEALAA